MADNAFKTLMPLLRDQLNAELIFACLGGMPSVFSTYLK